MSPAWPRSIVCLDLITDNGPRTCNPANLLLSMPDDQEMVRSQGHVLVSARHVNVLIGCTPSQVERFARKI